MEKYKNYMETIVEDKFDQLKDTLDCCSCEECRNDIIAYALNQLPTKYVSTHQGQMYQKLDTLSNQYQTDVITAIVNGSKLVKDHPRHHKD